MSQISQIQMIFQPLEDRILLRLNTTDSSSFQFWLTRRYLKLLWPVLIKMLASDRQVTVHKTVQAKKEVLSFQHQQVAQKMDYSQKFEEQSRSQPLGPEPVLLSRVSVKNKPDGTRILCMQPEQGQGIDLAMDQTLLHSICKLLQDATGKADWGLDLDKSLMTATASEAASDSRALN